MALLLDVTLASGLVAPNSYLRITSVYLVPKTRTLVSLSYFTSPTNSIAYQTIEQPVAYVLDGPNPIKQAYEHLKTLPEFADAVDC